LLNFPIQQQQLLSIQKTIDQQQETIDRQQKTIDRQQETIDRQQEILTELSDRVQELRETIESEDTESFISSGTGHKSIELGDVDNISFSDINHSILRPYNK
jgi:predicted nuclease with TOPRIM domain